MYNELVKRLRELASIPEHCENVADCDKCSKEEICLSFTNKRIIEVATQAADAIEELTHENGSLAKSVNEASEILRRRWIPVTERLPEVPGGYLVYLRCMSNHSVDWMDKYDLSYVTEFHFDKDQMLWVGQSESYNAVLSVVNTDNAYHVTHWMPLAEPPKEE